jgi:hypothetical protein
MGMEDARPWAWYYVPRITISARKSSRDADIRSHGEQSCANPKRFEFCFRTDSESDQVYRASLELEHLERDDLLY